MVLLFDGDGQSIGTTAIEDGPLDDSGHSPSLTTDGHPLITTIPGALSVLESDVARSLGFFGYDLPPPAVFDDNTLAVAGYAGKGYCRVRLDGSIVWQTELSDADGLPTIVRNQLSAVHSLNDKCSVIFDLEGRPRARLPFAALFAESLDDGWIAPDSHMIRRLSREGNVIWERPHRRPRGEQPIVDSENRICLSDASGVVCFNPNGSEQLKLGERESPPRGPALVAPGRLAVVIGDDLCVFE